MALPLLAVSFAASEIVHECLQAWRPEALIPRILCFRIIPARLTPSDNLRSRATPAVHDARKHGPTMPVRLPERRSISLLLAWID